MPTLVTRKPAKKAKPLQKQIDELTETVRVLADRVRSLEPRNVAYIDENGEITVSPEFDAEMDRRLQEVLDDPSKGIPHSEVKRYFEALAMANKS
jgi:hypothetical protein